MSANDFVPTGAPDHLRGTIEFAPSHVNRAGIIPPAGNAVLVRTSFGAPDADGREHHGRREGSGAQDESHRTKCLIFADAGRRP